jgi:5-methylcytosine-specific restriction endonuclease McrA
MTKDEMKKLIDESKSMREVILKLGLQPNGSSGYTSVKNKIVKLGLEIPKYNYYGVGHNRRRYSNDEVFCENSALPRHKIKNRIIKEKLIEYKCLECGNEGEYNGMALSLHLDHINGVNDDNRIENLRFLCPNCHSQTETYAGKANKK